MFPTYSRRSLVAPLATFSVLVLLLGSYPFQAQSQGLPTRFSAQIVAPETALPLDPAIAAKWHATDGDVLRGDAQRPWVWGPVALAMTVEHVPGLGDRRSVYFDKGRIDIAEPDGDRSSPWYAAGAPLVTELLSGAIRVGPNTWVNRADAGIPVTGDIEQSESVTYATLGKLATLPSAEAGNAGTTSPASGEAVTALLQPTGALLLNGVAMSDVTISGYDNVTRHNIAQPFVDWMGSLSDASMSVVGHALTEPYWIDTVVGGEHRRVLVQAFERRVLSYDPGSDAPWQVESANSGAHYRIWRELERPADPQLAALAALIPFGEEIVAAALLHRVDPFLLASIAKVTSDGNPLADPGTGHRGLVGVRGIIDDPSSNASAAASTLAGLAAGTPDTRAMLARYHAGKADIAAPSTIAFVDAVMATHPSLVAAFATPEASTVPIAARSVVTTPDHDTAWWNQAFTWSASWGGTIVESVPNSDGYFCATHDAVPGEQLRLTLGDTSVDCTVGARVGALGLPATDGILVSPVVIDALALSHNSIVEIERTAMIETTSDEANDIIVEIQEAPEDTTASEAQFSGPLQTSGPAAYYAPDYDRAWWDRTVALHASWGNAIANWQVDPKGYYCVHPDFRPGQRLRLVANGVTIDCTIGDSVQGDHEAMWRSRWAVELAWNTFVALGLDGNNVVEVYPLQ